MLNATKNRDHIFSSVSAKLLTQLQTNFDNLQETTRITFRELFFPDLEESFSLPV